MPTVGTHAGEVLVGGVTAGSATAPMRPEGQYRAPPGPRRRVLRGADDVVVD